MALAKKHITTRSGSRSNMFSSESSSNMF